MPDMTPAEVLAYFSESIHDAILATVNTDGQPHAVPVWYIVDAGDIVFSTDRESVKGRNILANPKVAVCISQPERPIMFVSVQGSVEEVTAPEEKRRLTSAIWGRYDDDAQAPSDAELQKSIVARVKARRMTGIRY